VTGVQTCALPIYTFPWQPSALRAWFLFGIGFTLVAFMGAAVHYIIDLYQGTDELKAAIWRRVMPLFIAALGLFVLWTGTFAAGFVLETVKGGGSGHSEVDWPDETIGEQFFTFLGFAFLYLLCAVPVGIASAPLMWYLGPMIIGLSLAVATIFIFPVGLMCSLANASLMNVWNSEIVGNFLLRPGVWLILYLMSTVLFGLCYGLGYLTIGLYEDFIFLSPVTGFVWSACLLIYARLLGRVAWIVTGAQEEAWRDARRWRKVRGR